MRLIRGWVTRKDRGSNAESDGSIFSLQIFVAKPGLPKRTSSFSQNRKKLETNGLKSLRIYREGPRIKSKIDLTLC